MKPHKSFAGQIGIQTDGKDTLPASNCSAAVKERARCAAIIRHGIKHANIEQAGVFAFQTDMEASDAIRIMETARQAGSLQQPARVHYLDPRAQARAIVNAGAKARGEDPNAPEKPPLYSRRPHVPDDLPPSAA